jgi:Zn-finger nucleic acid-binding protein
MSAYRDQLRACPRCTTPMERTGIGARKAAGDATEVDVCGKCRGVFVEFFDGEPGAISRGMVAQRAGRSGSTATATLPKGLTCPDCAAPMRPKPYLGKGPKLARCGQCLSAFLTPADVEALARLEHEVEPEPGQSETWVARLRGWLTAALTPTLGEPPRKKARAKRRRKA